MSDIVVLPRARHGRGYRGLPGLAPIELAGYTVPMLELLRVFIVVAERLHVTQAAAALNMAQSATSAAIRALEARLDVRLFSRVGRRIELTEAGRVLLPEARAVLARMAQAEAALDELAGLQRGHLRLFASQTVAGYWLPARLHRFRTAHPRISFDLAIGNTEQAARAVAAGEADLAFVEGEVEDPLLARIPVATDRLVLAVGAAHPWAGRDALPPSALLESSWVLRERGSGTRQALANALRGHGIDPEALTVAMELPSNEAVRAAVIAGAGATVISSLVAEQAIAAGALVEVPFPLPARPFVALLHGDRIRSRAAGALLEMARAS
jgi:DNA-binding transcriptional LysR family regulator